MIEIESNFSYSPLSEDNLKWDYKASTTKLIYDCLFIGTTEAAILIGGINLKADL